MIELGYGLLEPVSDPIQCFDHVERLVDRLELLAQPLDVACNADDEGENDRSLTTSDSKT
jgi:hypothetical protein